jgi:hypothetical protein
VVTADQRLWRTRDGEGLVLDGDPDAATLAYAPGDEIAQADVDKVPAEKQAAPKAKAPAANKARAKADDK